MSDLLNSFSGVVVPLGAAFLLSPFVGRGIAWLFREAPSASSQNMGSYARDFVLFQGMGFGFAFLCLFFQSYLPWNTAERPDLSAWRAFLTASSFLTGTNWQSFPPEKELSAFSCMAVLSFQNAMSSCSTLAATVAIIRGWTAPPGVPAVGWFVKDLLRSLFGFFLPVSCGVTLFLIFQGIPQTLEQPFAWQMAVSLVGANGGAPLAANLSHPWLNPSGFTQAFQLFWTLLLLPALIHAYGYWTHQRRPAWMLAGVFWVLGGFFLMNFLGIESLLIGGGSLEGQEMRFAGISSRVFSWATTWTSYGATPAALASFHPLSGGIFFIQVILGIGSSPLGLWVFLVLGLFLGNLLIGRSPEFLGKKILPEDLLWVLLALLLPSAATLLGTSYSLLGNPLSPASPALFFERLYAYASCAFLNGSAWGSFTGDSPWDSIGLGTVMWIGRLGTVLPLLAFAGNFATRPPGPPPSAETLSPDSLLFGGFLLGLFLILGALTFLPFLCLGPLAISAH